MRRDPKTENEIKYRTPARRDEPRRNSRRDGKEEYWEDISRRRRSSSDRRRSSESSIEEDRRRLREIRAEEQEILRRQNDRSRRRGSRNEEPEYNRRDSEDVWENLGRPGSDRQEKEYYKQSLKERRYKEENGRDSYEDRRKRPSVYETETRVKKKKKGKAKRVFKTILVILLILVIGLGVVAAIPSTRAAAVKAVLKSPFGPVFGNMIFGNSYEKYVHDQDFDESSVVIHDGVSVPKGNMTVALFGVDARAEDLEIGTMADSIVVVNVDREGNIKMASVFRDTYLMSRTQEGEEIISKANSAYYRGGPLGAVNMLNENFDLAITDYVVVNFWGLANIIDLLGGIRLTVTETEMDELNYYMYEQNLFGGTEYIPLEEYGDSVLLTGDQATAFCRLRSVNFVSPEDGITYNDDYGRAARQRYTLTELIKQTRELGVLKLMLIADDLFKANDGEKKFIQTSLDMKELIKWFAFGYDMNMAGSAGYPDLEHQYGAYLDSGATVVADTLEENVTLMHEFLYGTMGYEPSAGLREVAERIRAEVARQIGY